MGAGTEFSVSPKLSRDSSASINRNSEHCTEAQGEEALHRERSPVSKPSAKIAAGNQPESVSVAVLFARFGSGATAVASTSTVLVTPSTPAAVTVPTASKVT